MSRNFDHPELPLSLPFQPKPQPEPPKPPSRAVLAKRWFRRGWARVLSFLHLISTLHSAAQVVWLLYTLLALLLAWMVIKGPPIIETPWQTEVRPG